MSEVYEPPVAHWMARQWLAEDIATVHQPRPFLWWQRCAACQRRWPCPQRRWAERESLRRLP